jgi:hypothetical protein
MANKWVFVFTRGARSITAFRNLSLGNGVGSSSMLAGTKGRLFRSIGFSFWSARWRDFLYGTANSRLHVQQRPQLYQ